MPIKKGQQHNMSFDKQSTQSINKKNNEKLTSTQGHISNGRNPSCSCYKPLNENNEHLNCLRLYNHRTVLKNLQNPGFQMEDLYQ